MNSWAIYIPTYKRVSKQITLESIPKSLHNRMWLVVDYPERNKYKKAFPNANILVCPKGLKGLTEKKQFILDHVEPRFVFIIDDDVVFAHRRKDSTKLLQNEPKHTKKMFKLLVKWMKNNADIVICGVSYRGGNNRVLHKYVECTRQIGFHGFDRKKVKKLGIKHHCKLLFLGDMDFNLQVLKSGHKNRVTYQYTFNQVSNIEGGCSTQRNFKTQKKDCKLLRKYHKNFVKIRKAKTKWKDMPIRYDVTIQWKQAYKSGIDNA